MEVRLKACVSQLDSIKNALTHEILVLAIR